MTADTAPGAGTAASGLGIEGDVGDKIGDLRAHLCHAHPLRPDWVDEMAPAELAAIHRRLHGRAVQPDPSLMDVRMIELWTDPGDRAVTALPLAAATRKEDPLVWLPLRVADLVHHGDGPGHSPTGGCRACADVIEATIRALIELDTSPHRVIAELQTERDRLTLAVDRLLAALGAAPGALLAVARWAALLDTGDDTGGGDVVEIDHDAIEQARHDAEAELEQFLAIALEAGRIAHGGADNRR